MNDNKIILTTKGNISGADKQALRRAGIVIAEVKDINAIKIIAGTDYFDLDDLCLTSIETVFNHTDNSSLKTNFANLLLKRIISKTAKMKNQTPQP